LLLQTPLPFLYWQTTPQSPQLFGSASTLVSHFLPSLATHSRFGSVQSLTPHVESTHAGVPTEDVQMLPHAPQLPVLFVVSVSQPSLTPFTQSALP
jgi:hypothetical protein